MITYTKVYWINRIASLIIFFCLGIIAGLYLKSTNFVIVAFPLMMIACIAKIWAQRAAKQQIDERLKNLASAGGQGPKTSP
jgi:hypothetical protein